VPRSEEAAGGHPLKEGEATKQSDSDSWSGAEPQPILVAAEELDALRKKADEREAYRNELLRARADLDNFQKRTRKDRQSWEERATSQLIRKLLPSLDDLDRALLAADRIERGDDALAQGVKLTYQSLLKVLAEEGVEEIPSLGEQFDPNLHDAVMEVEVSDHPTGRIVEVLGKGYRRQGSVLRPARVAVARNTAKE
jgi:molecular chaperone GrpE